MKYLWRWLTGQCTACGQKLECKETVGKRMAEINKRSSQLANSLGRWPQVQSCKRCHKIVFEGEAGFVQSLLLIDIE